MICFVYLQRKLNPYALSAKEKILHIFFIFGLNGATCLVFKINTQVLKPLPARADQIAMSTIDKLWPTTKVRLSRYLST